MTITERLIAIKDDKNADFVCRLTPGILRENCLGARVPDVRRLAKEIMQEGNYKEFIHSLPHKYMDENLLHGAILSEIKDYEECIALVQEFLPYIDCWLVNDTICPKSFKKHKKELLPLVKEWIKSESEYVCRFGIFTLMKQYLKEDFEEEYLEIAASVKSDEYYVKMMLAWYFSTALVYHWDETLKLIKENRLEQWVHNKTIQKAVESLRISDENKKLLKSMKR